MFDLSIFRARRPQTPQELRWDGALMVVLGLLVLAGAAAFGSVLVDLPIPAHWLPAGASDLRWLGIVAVAFALLVFGTAAIVQGLLQLVFARQSRPLVRIMLVIALLFMVVDVIASDQ